MVLGRIDWFGGLNKKTGRVNNFGFIIPNGEYADEGIYVARNDVPLQWQTLLEPGVYVQFEIVTDRSGKKRAVNIELVSDVGLINWFDKGRGYITCENRSDLRVEASEIFQSGDVVFFYIKYSEKHRKEQAILVKKVNPLTKNEILIKKCAQSNLSEIFAPFIVKYATTLPVDEAIEFILEKVKLSKFGCASVAENLIHQADHLLLASPELRKLLISGSFVSLSSERGISLFCQFINRHINLAVNSVNQELLDELLDLVRQPNDQLRSSYWSQVNFLKEALQYKGYLWDIAPRDAKSNFLKNKYKSFFDIIERFDKSEYKHAGALSFSWKELYQLDERERELVRRWCSGSGGSISSFEEAQMISARGAEKLVVKFYEALGYAVEDTSIHQVTQESTTWQKGDVRLDSEILIDVKNARTSVNSKTSYSEFCVPAFKTDRGEDVIITAVLSPYLQKELMDGQDPSFSVPDPLVLGYFKKASLSDLKSRFSDSRLSIDLSRDEKTYLPPWLFDYNRRFYVNQDEIIADFKKLRDADIPEWEDILDVGIRPLPLFVAAQRKIPEKWISYFPEWKINFISLLLRAPENRITLPDIFLSLLKHFLMMLPYEGFDYSPRQYQEILFTDSSQNSSPNHFISRLQSPNTSSKPLKLYDPLNIVKDFCATLQTLWECRHSANLTGFNIFKFNHKGLLQGKRSREDNKWTTILAYCGGRVEKKGSCGYRPLVIGAHENCSICGRLICPKENCQHCSDNCEGYRQRKLRIIGK
jgi:cold shock CspA family protein